MELLTKTYFDRGPEDLTLADAEKEAESGSIKLGVGPTRTQNRLSTQ